MCVEKGFVVDVDAAANSMEQEEQLEDSDTLQVLLLAECRQTAAYTASIAASLLCQLNPEAGAPEADSVDRVIESSHERIRFEVVDATKPDVGGEVIRSLLAGTSFVDVAALVINAARPEFEAGIVEGRTCEHLFLVSALGLRKLVVIADNMQHPGVAFSEQRYKEVLAGLVEPLQRAGFEPPDVPVVPTAQLASPGQAQPAMSWYSGPLLREAVAQLGAPLDLGKRPLRIPLHEVYKVRGAEVVAVGRVEMGTLRSGVPLAASPGGLPIQVRRLEVDGRPAVEAAPGKAVRFVGLGSSEKLGTSVAVGDVVCEASRDPAIGCLQFLAQLVVLGEPPKGSIRKGYSPLLDIHATRVPCEIVELCWRQPRKNGGAPGTAPRLDLLPPALGVGDVAEVWLKPSEPVCLEVFATCPALGRFALRDHEVTVAAGIVKEVRRRSRQVACFED